MDTREEAILATADIAREGEALSQAALLCDFDEARFRASLILEKATDARLDRVTAAAAHALERLGPVGGIPHSNYGHALMQLAAAVDVLWFDRR